jgi:hypothetical protein
MERLLAQGSSRCLSRPIAVILLQTLLENVPLSYAFILDFNLPSGN